MEGGRVNAALSKPPRTSSHRGVYLFYLLFASEAIIMIHINISVTAEAALLYCTEPLTKAVLTLRMWHEGAGSGRSLARGCQSRCPSLDESPNQARGQGDWAESSNPSFVPECLRTQQYHIRTLYGQTTDTEWVFLWSRELRLGDGWSSVVEGRPRPLTPPGLISYYAD